MSAHTDAANNLYGLVEKSLGKLPEDAQASARGELAGLQAMTERSGDALERLGETAARHAAEKPAADAALKHAMTTKIFGMKPSTAIIGAVAVDGLVIGATKFMQGRQTGKLPQGQWSAKIDRERATAQGRQL